MNSILPSAQTDNEQNEFRIIRRAVINLKKGNFIYLMVQLNKRTAHKNATVRLQMYLI